MAIRVEGIVILDREGKRIATKYVKKSVCSNLKDFENRRMVEVHITKKMDKHNIVSEGDIISVDDCIVILKCTDDIIIAVIGYKDENPAVLFEVLNTTHSTLQLICGSCYGKKCLYQNLDSVFIMLDEIIDGSTIFELDSSVILSRINMVNEGVAIGNESTVFNQAFTTARDNIVKNFL